MKPTTKCISCGEAKREPFTPAGFSTLKHCLRCDRPVCEGCGENDIDGTTCGRDDCEDV